MNNLPPHLADAVKKEAENNLKFQGHPIGKAANEVFIAGASFLYSIQPTVRWVKASERLPEKSGVYFVKIEKWGAKAKLIYSKELGWMYDERRVILVDDFPTQWLEELPSPPKETAGSQEGVSFVWTDELVKEMIYSKLPIPDHYAGNIQKCLDEFKQSDPLPERDKAGISARLAEDCWLFLTNDKMPESATINKVAFIHEVKAMIISAILKSKK